MAMEDPAAPVDTAARADTEAPEGPADMAARAVWAECLRADRWAAACGTGLWAAVCGADPRWMAVCHPGAADAAAVCSR